MKNTLINTLRERFVSFSVTTLIPNSNVNAINSIKVEDKTTIGGCCTAQVYLANCSTYIYNCKQKLKSFKLLQMMFLPTLADNENILVSLNIKASTKLVI